jgi:predicted SAM-dependent methyltransferase
MMGYNLGSGQRRFESVPGVIDWINVDIISRPPDQVPDVICKIEDLPEMFGTGNADYVVAHHLCEHWGLGEFPFRTCYDLLKPGGSLLIFIPDIRALAIRWLEGGISDYIYVVNLMGAYMGLETDRHKWHHTANSLGKALYECADWTAYITFDWRTVPGMNAARDWWIMSMEAVK